MKCEFISSSSESTTEPAFLHCQKVDPHNATQVMCISRGRPTVPSAHICVLNCCRVIYFNVERGFWLQVLTTCFRISVERWRRVQHSWLYIVLWCVIDRELIRKLFFLDSSLVWCGPLLTSAGSSPTTHFRQSSVSQLSHRLVYFYSCSCIVGCHPILTKELRRFLDYNR